MKEIPNKIYIDEDLINYHCLTYRCDGDLEYIRKDALLEKLEKVAAEYKKRSDEGELVWQNMCGINLVIDILNKM